MPCGGIAVYGELPGLIGAFAPDVEWFGIRADPGRYSPVFHQDAFFVPYTSLAGQPIAHLGLVDGKQRYTDSLRC